MKKIVSINQPYAPAVAAVIFLMICYRLALSPTIVECQLHRRLERRLASTTGTSYLPGYTTRKQANLDRLVRRYETDTAGFRDGVIDRLSVIAAQQQVRLSSVPAIDPVFSHPQLLVAKFQMEGDLFALLRVLAELEKEPVNGLVRSVCITGPGPAASATGQKKVTLELYLTAIKNKPFN